MVRSSVLSSTRRRGSISFVSTTNPIAVREQQETHVQRREAAVLLMDYGFVLGSAGSERFLKARTEMTTATTRMTNSMSGLFVQLAGRKNRGNDARHAKKLTIPNPRTSNKAMGGQLNCLPLKGN